MGSSEAEPQVKTQKEKDLELWRAYRAAPSQMTLSPLMKALDPIIQTEVNKWSGAIGRPPIEAEAKKLALEAIDNYNPDSGAALATHVTNRLLKLSRAVYTHQDAVRLPEYKKLNVLTYNKTFSDLQGNLGRDPTNQELADTLAWSPRKLSQVQSAINQELVQSMDVGAGMFEQSSMWGSDSDDGVLEYMYFDMSPEDKILFEHSTGYTGKPVLSNPELAAKLGITPAQLSYRKKLLIAKIKKQQG